MFDFLKRIWRAFIDKCTPGYIKARRYEESRQRLIQADRLRNAAIARGDIPPLQSRTHLVLTKNSLMLGTSSEEQQQFEKQQTRHWEVQRQRAEAKYRARRKAQVEQRSIQSPAPAPARKEDPLTKAVRIRRRAADRLVEHLKTVRIRMPNGQTRSMGIKQRNAILRQYRTGGRVTNQQALRFIQSQGLPYCPRKR